MSKRKPRRVKKKPPICDPAQCDYCLYIGEGDFICEGSMPGGMSLVVEDWQPTGASANCPKMRERDW